MNLSEYDESKLAESRERVAQGMLPLRRTSLPGTVKVLDMSVVLTTDDNLSLISLTDPQIVLLDDATLHQASKSLSPDAAHILRFAARNPFITSVVVVTDALSRCYWSPDPDGSGSAEMWAKAFRLDPHGVNTPRSLFELASTPEMPFVNGLPPLKDESIVGLLSREKSGYATSYEALELFDKLESVGDVGAFYMRTDRLLRERFIHNGEVVVLSDIAPPGNGVVSGVLSSPCKLRVAKPLVVVLGTEMFNTEIVKISYRKGSGLVGSIKTTGRGLSTSRLMAKNTVYLTAKSYSGQAPAQSLAIRERSSVREVPLDVTLAAVGDTTGER
jgi:hypothetical protein